VTQVAVAGFAPLERGARVALTPSAGTLALDGEREIERRHGAAVTVRLADGPRTIDVDAVMRHAASAELLHAAAPAQRASR
jgi:7,8-dihydro-6-hydroxymethylpterin-pyrophosphokinase